MTVQYILVTINSCKSCDQVWYLDNVCIFNEDILIYESACPGLSQVCVSQAEIRDISVLCVGWFSENRFHPPPSDTLQPTFLLKSKHHCVVTWSSGTEGRRYQREFLGFKLGVGDFCVYHWLVLISQDWLVNESSSLVRLREACSGPVSLTFQPIIRVASAVSAKPEEVGKNCNQKCLRLMIAKIRYRRRHNVILCSKMSLNFPNSVHWVAETGCLFLMLVL